MPLRDPAKRRKYDRAYKLQRRYGITIKERQALLKKQNNLCANDQCNASEGKTRGQRLVTDHCKFALHVRGLLCNSCNLAMGHLGHDPERIRGLAKYLERTN